MSLPDDEELRAQFHELRDEDRADAPSFRALLARAKANTRAPRRAGVASGLWMSLAASLILAVGVAMGRSRDVDPARLLAGQRGSDTSAVPSISEWTSPTASFLRTSGHELLSPPPILGSVLDGLTRASGPPPGDRQ